MGCQINRRPEGRVGNAQTVQRRRRCLHETRGQVCADGTFMPPPPPLNHSWAPLMLQAMWKKKSRGPGQDGGGSVPAQLEQKMRKRPAWEWSLSTAAALVFAFISSCLYQISCGKVAHYLPELSGPVGTLASKLNVSSLVWGEAQYLVPVP